MCESYFELQVTINVKIVETYMYVQEGEDDKKVKFQSYVNKSLYLKIPYYKNDTKRMETTSLPESAFLSFYFFVK